VVLGWVAGRIGLLGGIKNFSKTKLKLTQTNDKSKPVLKEDSDSASASGSGSGSAAAGAAGAATAAPAPAAPKIRSSVFATAKTPTKAGAAPRASLTAKATTTNHSSLTTLPSLYALANNAVAAISPPTAGPDAMSPELAIKFEGAVLFAIDMSNSMKGHRHTATAPPAHAHTLHCSALYCTAHHSCCVAAHSCACVGVCLALQQRRSGGKSLPKPCGTLHVCVRARAEG
jgi:hypothetical protein